MTHPSPPLMANAGFNNADLHFLKQGIAKVISESRNHSLALCSTPSCSVGEVESTLLEYYEKRINKASALLKRLEVMQEEIARKEKSVAHNLA